MNYENIQLKGVTRKPDDSLSSNGELAVALDLVHDGDGLRTGEQPTQLFTTEGKSVIFIHQNAGYKHYISYAIANNVTTLYYRVGTSGTDTAIHTLTGGITAISSVGNTIIVNDGTGLNYILWDASQQTYRFLGQKPPFINIRFGLSSELTYYPKADVKAPHFVRDYIEGDNVPVPAYGTDGYFVPPQSSTSTNFEFTFSLENRSGNEGDGPVNNLISDITQFVMANINAFINKEGNEMNRFIFPFFVRYAYELYDGSYIMHSVPTLLIPNSHGPIFGLFAAGNDSSGSSNDDLDKYFAGFKSHDKTNNKVALAFRGRAYGFASDLDVELMSSSTVIDTLRDDWKDIVKNVSIFVTPPIYTHDQSGEVTGWKSMDTNVDGNEHAWDEYFTIGKIAENHGGGDSYLWKPQMFKDVFEADSRQGSNGSEHDLTFFQPHLESGHDCRYPAYILPLPLRKKEELDTQLKNAGQFFKVKTIELDDLGIGTVTLEDNVLSTLTSQTQLTNDYYSHDTLASSVLYPYNRRLNLGGVTRTIADPIPCHIQWMKRTDATGVRQWRMAVFSKNNAITTNYSGVLDYNDADLPHYIFVPDPDAYKVQLYNNNLQSYQVIELPLSPHPYLHGAFWLGDISKTYAYDGVHYAESSSIIYKYLKGTQSSPVRIPQTNSNHIIEGDNLVYTSEVENPFVFTPENVNAVGDGRILALCSNTTMLSHEVFGREPMYVFTEQGVWPMTVGTTGVFSSVQMPNVRDVILPGTKPLPITQGILFLTKRGLLAMNGNSVKVMSEDINNDFLAEFDKLTELVTTIFNASYAAKVNAFTDFRNDSANARLAYDYRNQRVYVALGNGCWVLNLKSTLWTQSSTVIGTPLNSFPDCEFATGNSVYTIGSARKDTGLLLTRPVKTGSEFYANIKEMAARGNFSINDAPVITALFGTRNYINNYLLKSSTRPRITRFGGSPFKAHSFFAAIKNPSALTDTADKTYIDRFVIGIDTFQRNKLR